METGRLANACQISGDKFTVMEGETRRNFSGLPRPYSGPGKVLKRDLRAPDWELRYRAAM